MIVYCSKCKTNWARLWNEESGNDVVEFCPECKTDSFLEAGNDIIGYIKCGITGNIINTTTGLTIDQENPKPFVKPKIRIKVGKPTYQEMIEAREKQEDAAMDAYIETGDEKLFFSLIKKAI